MGTKSGDSITVYYNSSYPSIGNVYRVDFDALYSIAMLLPLWIVLVVFTKVKQREYIKRKRVVSNKDGAVDIKV